MKGAGLKGPPSTGSFRRDSLLLGYYRKWFSPRPLPTVRLSCSRFGKLKRHISDMSGEEEVGSPADALAAFPGSHAVSLKDCGCSEGEQIRRFA